MFAMFSTPVLREWAWPRAHMNVTTFTQFAQNGWKGCLLALYDSTMHVATLKAYPQAEFLALQCCTLKSLLLSVQHC